MLTSMVLWLFLAPATARPALTGTVKGPDGHPVRDAMVFVYTAHPRTGSSTTCPSCYLDCRKRAETNETGEFTIPSLNPTLLFQIGATGEGFRASFRTAVDPTAGPLEITLEALAPLPDNPRRVVRARLVDPAGAPVLGALVEPIGYRIDSANGGYSDSFGPMGVDPVITGPSGSLALAIPQDVDSLYLKVDARGLASKTFGGVATGGKETVLRLGEGRGVRGRVMLGGQPLVGASIGAAQISRNTETFVGELTAETDAGGRFLFVNLPPDEPLVLYGKLEGLGGRGSIAEREIVADAEGSVRDLGDLVLETGVVLSGRVVLSDGKPVPPQTRISVYRLRAWDRSELALAPDGSFRFGPLPREGMTVSVSVPGYRLSSKNESALPDRASPIPSLGGRLDQDTELLIVLEPIGDRKPEPPPRTGDEWLALHSQEQAVRAKPLRGAPVP